MKNDTQKVINFIRYLTILFERYVISQIEIEILIFEIFYSNIK